VEAPPPPADDEDVVDGESGGWEGGGDVISGAIGNVEGDGAQAVAGGEGGGERGERGEGGEGGEGGGAVDDKQGKKDDRLAFLMLDACKTKVPNPKPKTLKRMTASLS
jgi:hypothetical protein